MSVPKVPKGPSPGRVKGLGRSPVNGMALTHRAHSEDQGRDATQPATPTTENFESSESKRNVGGTRGVGTTTQQASGRPTVQ